MAEFVQGLDRDQGQPVTEHARPGQRVDQGGRKMFPVAVDLDQAEAEGAQAEGKEARRVEEVEVPGPAAQPAVRTQ